MQISEQGITLIKKWEGLSLTAYRDAAGYWSIGYGHFIGTKTLPEEYNKTLTLEDAERLLRKDIEESERRVNLFQGNYRFNQNQYDALVSFCFNIGNISNLTNNGKRSIAEIAAVIPQYCNAGGKKLRGLYNRRMEELSLFLEPITIESTLSGETPFLYKVTIDNLLIRQGAGKEYSYNKNSDGTAMHTGKGVFTITDVFNGWGKLKSGTGWISLDKNYGYRLK